ncbi:hypothetical protein BD410DRAFT_816684 [Rickenella mellea]|uniref:Alpha/beta-hydrolase n=1 Tax=Rickenella mellea TaxID=50990 RepID=A0A4Y7PPV3_9AGAM|nr:hypothetical protein BD410DRAFT_816684 [Rickenella mellea]
MIRRLTRSVTTYSHHHLASHTAPREVPTPLVFLSTNALDRSSAKSLHELASSLTRQGFSSLELDLSLSSPTQTLRTSEEVLQNAASELREAITTSPSPFPPVLVARGLASLVAQTYISSYPASALLLIDPPASPKTYPLSSSEARKFLPTKVKDFDFEPRFPVALIATPDSDSSSTSLTEHRLVSAGADVFLAKREEDVMSLLENWLDELGV